MKLDMHTYELVRRRAAYPILLKYRVNRYELWLLCQMAGFLKHKGKPIVSRAIFFKSVTGNHTEKKKMSGYYIGLLTKKMVGAFEWVAKPGSECFGISELGAHVLGEYEKHLATLIDRMELKRETFDPFETGSTGGYHYYRKSA